ncbi:uncharacterized protein PFL1_06812 [Pseudozyma flocculosa PF-1]|uniref:Glycoside hydrolase family 92 protein n=2 Tax=Pseudozyma flocculosa TaxID=84751 RepID=A0A061H0H1_9BASI|nr:uncharacterized protein PFL1_06812 [Pseudozyma flocculosa PF-1]EPQ25632.1 hypothetical protein PFL1_06812 [Pseudozyma flocculosa PF-1]SPO38547.1 related to putative alpha-1,2-mannosidase [Pseudozyma flocculosa]
MPSRSAVTCGSLLSLLALSTSFGVTAATDAQRLTTYVDPLIGTEGPTPGSAIAGGNAFPGAALPWGMAKPGIDTSYLGLAPGLAVDVNSGYSPLGNLTAVSMMHVHGTGGAPTYGIISQMPIYGSLDAVNLADNTTYWQNRSLAAERAQVGRFSTSLLNGVNISMSASSHSAVVRYDFPSCDQERHILVDLTHVLPANSSFAYTQKFTGGALKLGRDSYEGHATYSGGWAQASAHKVYFCSNMTSVSGQAKGETFSWQYDPFHPPSTKPVLRPFQSVQAGAGSGMGIGALFTHPPTQAAQCSIESRIGISYISSQRACQHIRDELPESKTIDDVVAEAETAWHDRVLNRVRVVDDGNPISSNATLKRMLYTALYQMALLPTDKTNEQPNWKSSDLEPAYDDFYTLWDLYSHTMPLYHLIFTGEFSRILRSMIAIWKFEGFMPTGRSAQTNGRVQGGTHADFILADAFLKSTGKGPGKLAAEGRNEVYGVDWQQAFKAADKDASVLPERNADPVAFDGATKEGRGALDEYNDYGFITRNHTRSVSRTIEYAFNDFGIYALASGLKKAAKVLDRYRKQASRWTLIWNPDASTELAGVGSFRGFPCPRNADGSWNTTNYDPKSCGGCGWGDDLYEAKVWETAFGSAPHDTAKLIELMGGDDAFLKRLEASFLPGFGTSVGVNNDAGTSLWNAGNEPSFTAPFLYNLVPGNAWRTVNETRHIVDRYYSDTRNGYPGNVDAGALNSWLLWNLVGLSPLAPLPIYFISAPRFPTLEMDLFAGTNSSTTLRITANKLDTQSNFYPQSVTLNGRPVKRGWLWHHELAQGGDLVFEMGPEPAQWDKDGERVPSLSTGDFD